MIDCETEIFDVNDTALKAVYPTISVSGDSTISPSEFPHVSIVQIDNPVNVKTQDEGIENHSIPTFEVNVYSDLAIGKKAQCKEIFAIIDGVFAGKNFTRIMYNPIPNPADPTIYREIARYRAIVGSDGLVYRR